MSNQKPSCGRILHYKLSSTDVENISRRRKDYQQTEVPAWPKGAQAHVGNPVSVGDEVPLIVVRVFDDEYGPDVPGVNGQILLDGNDSLWVLSIPEGTKPGTWHWPERV